MGWLDKSQEKQSFDELHELEYLDIIAQEAIFEE